VSADNQRMNTIPLSAFPSASSEIRRNQYGHYLIIPPGGDTPLLGYIRATTVAGATDDGGGLGPWKATMAVCGTLRQRSIKAKWQTLLAEHESPWYANPESKAKCKKLVEEAAEAGGAGDRREEGLSLHAITALVDVGDTPAHLSAETEADVSAYANKLIEYGVAIVPGMVERTVVLDEHRVAGTFDRLVRIRGRELPMVADLKTGADLSYSWRSIAVQLAIYAHADSLYEQGADPNGSADVRSPMPEVDQHEALVMWLPAGEARCELIVVDLDAGWEGFELSMQVRKWRQRKGLSWPLSQWVPAPEPVAPPRPKLTLLDPLPVETIRAIESAPLPDVSHDHVAEVRAWLQERIDVCGGWADETRADLGRSWPEGMPTLRASTTHTSEQLAQIEAVVDGVEARHSVPFGPSKPGTTVTHEDRVIGRLRATFPGSTVEPDNEETS
jgi:hypothetical protein